MKVVADLPGVGQNLMDHPILNGLSWTHAHNSTLPNIGDLLTTDAINQFIDKREGQYSGCVCVCVTTWMERERAVGKVYLA